MCPTRYAKHQDDIITGVFSSTMMADWDNDDVNLLKWRAETAETGFEKTPAGEMHMRDEHARERARVYLQSYCVQVGLVT